MSSNPPATSQSFGRTFVVAATVLGVLALAQLGAVTVALFTKKGGLAVMPSGEETPKPAPTKIDVGNLPGPGSEASGAPGPNESLNVDGDPIADNKPVRPQPAPAESPVAVPENPSSSGSTPATGTSGVAPLMPPRPTPVPIASLTPKQNPRFAELIEQGKFLRSNGDTAGALLRFREAALLEPTNALPLAESAFTFEEMSLPDKAADQWRQILAMGKSAGVYYSAAQGKLSAAISDAARASMAKQPAAVTIPEGKTLAVSPPKMEEDHDPGVSKRFTLHVPIFAKAGQQLSVRDVKVFVLFYEKVGGKDIVRTTANVSNQWENPPIDWADGQETLDVTYELPKNDDRNVPREYYGYIIRVYYNNELQDTQAQPPNLNQRFPAEYQLPEN